MLLTSSALEKKAGDLVLLDVSKISSFTDFFVICSGRSDRQVQSIARGIEEDLGKVGIKPMSLEGYSRGQWVLMDFSDVVVHIFYEPVREFYDLENLWSHAPRKELPEHYAALVNQFRSRDDAF